MKEENKNNIERNNTNQNSMPKKDEVVYKDEAKTHHIVPNDFSTTYIPVDMEIPGLSINNGKSKQ